MKRSGVCSFVLLRAFGNRQVILLDVLAIARLEFLVGPLHDCVAVALWQKSPAAPHVGTFGHARALGCSAGGSARRLVRARARLGRATLRRLAGFIALPCLARLAL